MIHPTRFVSLALVVFASMVGCSKTEAPKPEAAKQVQAATSAAPKAAEPAKPTAAKKAKPPVKKALPAEKKPHPVPENWDILVDNVRHYGFAVPSGTKDHHETKDGVDIYTAELPKPGDIKVFGVAYKDKTKSKEDLIEEAESILKLLGNTEVKMGSAKELTADYDLVDATCKAEDGKEWKIRVLIATDVTDNFLLLVGAPASEFGANEATIDTIWGSFDMFSGGASGES